MTGTRRPSSAQRKLLYLLASGDRLWWFGDSGPEVSSIPFWPQKRTVLALLKSGELRCKPYANPTQRECGIREIEINPMHRASPQ